MNLRVPLLRLIAVFVVTIAAVAAQTADFDALRRKADTGDASAEFELFRAYIEGTMVKSDPVQGIAWLRKSAGHGYAAAEVSLGYMYQKGSPGLGIEKDPHIAASWYRKAARQSDKDAKHAQTAQSNLGAMATEGLISVQEADWRAAEPGSEPVQQANNSGVKTGAGKNNRSKNKTIPFSLSEVETGLTGGITSKRMATLISQYGVDFSLSSSAKQRLTNDGADDTLLQTIASAKH